LSGDSNGDRVLRERFERDGYVIVKQLLDPETAAGYRAELQRLSGLGDDDYVKVANDGGWAHNDGVTKLPQFWPLIFNPKLLETVHAAIGPDARYTQHSDLLVHAGQPGWHRDSADRAFRKGGDWDESRARYRIGRVAIYLQSHRESGSGLAVVPGSHRRQPFLTTVEMNIWDRINQRRKRKGEPTVLPRFKTMKTVLIETDPGDCLIFDERLLHSATRIQGPKYAIFLSYGGDDEHSRRMRRYWIVDRTDTAYEEYPPELAQKLKAADLYLPLDSEPESEPAASSG
jgi:hypothetical protein